MEVVMKRDPRDDIEEMIAKVKDREFRNKLSQVWDALNAMNSVPEGESSFVSVKIARAAVETHLQKQIPKTERGNRDLALLLSELKSSEDRWVEFEETLGKEVDRMLIDVDRELLQAFLDRLSPGAKKRCDELNRGDVRFPHDDMRGLVKINLTMNQKITLLSYSDGKFEVFEREVFLPRLNRFDFVRELGLKKGQGTLYKGFIVYKKRKYSDKMFRQVDRLITNRNYKQNKALEQVFNSNGFSEHRGDSLEGLKKKYYKYQDRVGKGKRSSL